MRLDKFVAHGTGLPRSKVKALIAKGKITIDGSICRDSGQPVSPDQHRILLNNQPVYSLKHRYIMLNKPAGYQCSTVSEDHPSALSLLTGEPMTKLHFAGRLDVDTTGLTLITDDGQWSHRLTSPRRKIEKCYVVDVAEPLNPSNIQRFAEGVLLHNETKPTLPAELEIVSAHQGRLTITEGRYHQVKRMFGAIGNKVVRLHREHVGTIMLDPALAPGQWRALSEQEIRSV